MSGPAGQVLGESYRAEGGVTAAPREVCRLKIQGAQLVKTFCARMGESIEQLRERFALT